MATRETKAQLEAERDELKRKLDNLWAALEEEAQNRDWCEAYDEFVEEHGGPQRAPTDVEFVVHLVLSVKGVPNSPSAVNRVRNRADSEESLVNFIHASIRTDAVLENLVRRDVLDSDWDQDATELQDLVIDRIELL